MVFVPEWQVKMVAWLLRQEEQKEEKNFLLND